MSLAFTSIRLRNWRQFEEVEIDVHPRLTVITGANGAGKSTILNLFSQHFGYARPFLATPKKKKGGGIAYDSGYYARSNFFAEESADDELDDEDELEIAARIRSENRFFKKLDPPVLGEFINIGEISYSNDVVSSLGYHDQQVNAYGITVPMQQPVLGVAIGSHRTVAAYQPVQGLSLATIEIAQAYQSFINEYWTRLNGGHTGFSPIYRMKESLIAMAAFGEGNSYLESNQVLSDAFVGFVKILRKVLPRELGFQKLVVRVPDVVMKTRTGEFTVDSGSGGINAIIEIAWQIYLFSLTHPVFVATLDEPENHLHPAMQRTILKNLIDAFPNVQFIVATHSPFIVSAVEDSSVYALRYVGGGDTRSGLPRYGARRVQSVYLDQTTKAGTASEILREVLGVSVGIPDWAQVRLDGIVDRYEGVEIDVEALKTLRIDLASAGFSEFYPEALARLVEGR